MHLPGHRHRAQPNPSYASHDLGRTLRFQLHGGPPSRQSTRLRPMLPRCSPGCLTSKPSQGVPRSTHSVIHGCISKLIALQRVIYPTRHDVARPINREIGPQSHRQMPANGHGRWSGGAFDRRDLATWGSGERCKASTAFRTPFQRRSTEFTRALKGDSP